MKFKLIIDKEKEEEIVVTAHSANDFVAKIEDLVLGYNGSEELVAYDEGELLRLSFRETDCITIIDRKTYAINSVGKQYRLSETLSSIEKKMPSYFIRINKSSIANERRIKALKMGFRGSVDVIFKSGYKDYVSRRCFREIKRRYGK